MKERISETPLSAPQTPLAAPKAFVPDMSDDQLRKLAREQLSKALQHVDAVSQPEMTRKLCAELMDRLDGRPAQSVDVTGKIGIVQIVAQMGKREKNQLIDHVSHDIESISSPIDK